MSDLCAEVDARLIRLGFDPFPLFPQSSAQQSARAWRELSTTPVPCQTTTHAAPQTSGELAVLAKRQLSMLQSLDRVLQSCDRIIHGTCGSHGTYGPSNAPVFERPQYTWPIPGWSYLGPIKFPEWKSAQAAPQSARRQSEQSARRQSEQSTRGQPEQSTRGQPEQSTRGQSEYRTKTSERLDTKAQGPPAGKTAVTHDFKYGLAQDAMQAGSPESVGPVKAASDRTDAAARETLMQQDVKQGAPHAQDAMHTGSPESVGPVKAASRAGSDLTEAAARETLMREILDSDELTFDPNASVNQRRLKLKAGVSRMQCDQSVSLIFRLLELQNAEDTFPGLLPYLPQDLHNQFTALMMLKNMPRPASLDTVSHPAATRPPNADSGNAKNKAKRKTNAAQATDQTGQVKPDGRLRLPKLEWKSMKGEIKRDTSDNKVHIKVAHSKDVKEEKIQERVWTLECEGRQIRCGPVSAEAESDHDWLRSYFVNALRARGLEPCSSSTPCPIDLSPATRQAQVITTPDASIAGSVTVAPPHSKDKPAKFGDSNAAKKPVDVSCGPQLVIHFFAAPTHDIGKPDDKSDQDDKNKAGNTTVSRVHSDPEADSLRRAFTVASDTLRATLQEFLDAWSIYSAGRSLPSSTRHVSCTEQFVVQRHDTNMCRPGCAVCASVAEAPLFTPTRPFYIYTCAMIDSDVTAPQNDMAELITLS